MKIPLKWNKRPFLFKVFLTALILAGIDSEGEAQTYSSFQSYNYPTYYICHQNYLGEILQSNSISDKRSATFRMVPGLANSAYVSFESMDHPGIFFAIRILESSSIRRVVNGFLLRMQHLE